MGKIEAKRNSVRITNINKFLRMNLEDLREKEFKHKIELNEDNYHYLLSIKNNSLNNFTNPKHFEKINKFVTYFFREIPITIQKSMLKAYHQKDLHKTSEKKFQELLLERYRFEYVQILNSYLYSLKHLT
jgi:hypothetical protein